MSRTIENILGFDVFAGSLDVCVSEIAGAIRIGEKCVWLACLNPHSYAISADRPKFAAALARSDWLVPDGVGIVLASKVLGGSIQGRVTGNDVFFALHNVLQLHGGATVFFLGSTEDTLSKIQQKMSDDWPGIKVVGTYSPPFKKSFSESDVDAMIKAVNAVKPDVLWVGMTAPKQEEWIANSIHRLDVRFAGAIGAVFDFYVGTITRSHPAFQKLGLEWLPRLLQEPKRLWRRMFVSAPIFVWHVIRDRLGMM